MVLFSYKKRVPFLIPKGKDGKRMKKIKMFMGAVLCMNLLAVSGCDRVVQSAVVEEKDETDQKKEENKKTVQETVAEQVEASDFLYPPDPPILNPPGLLPDKFPVPLPVLQMHR